MFRYELTKQQDAIARQILDDMYPDSVFEDKEREEKALQDIKWMLQFVVEGMGANNVTIVENLLLWFQRLFKGLDIDPSHAKLLYDSTKRVLHHRFKNDELDAFLNRIVYEDLEEHSILLTNNPYLKQQKQYLEMLLDSDRVGAQYHINEMLDNHVPIEDIYLYVFQETMREIGMMWQNGMINVGREHYATAVTQYLMGTLYRHIFQNTPKKHRLLAAAVGSEMHEMGIRMVADIFELKGWDTNYLGANLPKDHLIQFAKEQKPDVIALSITMPYHVSTLRDTIAAIRGDKDLENVKVLVGGLPFLNNEKLYENLGADAYASNAIEGVQIANQLLQ